jgi:hypothetical protein
MSKIDKLINYANSTNIDNVADLYLFDIITYRELETVVSQMNVNNNPQEYLDRVQKAYDDLHMP